MLEHKYKDSILYDIILANKWNSKDERMVVDNSTAYNIFGGPDFSLQLKCNSDIKTYQWIYAMKPKGNENNKQGLFDNQIKFLKEFIVEQFAESIEEVKFVLSRNGGLHIEDTHDKKSRFVTNSGEVEPGSYQWVSWANNDYKVVDDSKTNTWTLISPFAYDDDDSRAKQYEDSDKIFYIQMPYG